MKYSINRIKKILHDNSMSCKHCKSTYWTDGINDNGSVFCSEDHADTYARIEAIAETVKRSKFYGVHL